MVVRTTKESPILTDLAKMPLETAQELVTAEFKGSMKNPLKLQHLTRDVMNAPTAREVERIYWQAQLAKGGLSVTNSRWQREHR